MTNVIIEKAKQQDRAAILAILKQVNMHYIPSQEMPELTYENYFVARINGKVVGFCGYKILSKTEAKTELMAVDMSCRGKGIGYSLQLRRMEDMLEKGIEILTTNADIPETIEWYKKNFGYKEIGKLKKYNEFSRPDIDHWTTLQVNMLEWNKTRKGLS